MRNIGAFILITGLLFFSTLSFYGKFEFSEASIIKHLPEKVSNQIGAELIAEIDGKTYNTPYAFSLVFTEIFEKKNNSLKKQERWDDVMWEQPETLMLKLLQKNNQSYFAKNNGLGFFLAFVLSIVGGLFMILSQFTRKNTIKKRKAAVYAKKLTSRGLIALIFTAYLITFYVVLYFNPHLMVNQIAITTPIKKLFSNELPSQWFLYGMTYTIIMLIFGIKAILKYRNNSYQIFKTTVVVMFQLIFAFLLVEIMPLFQLPATDLKNAWPLNYDFLFDYNILNLIENGNFGKYIFIWGIILSLVIVPLFTYLFGKRWYCSWVCGCGGLAETFGDEFRHLSNKSLFSWKFERYSIHAVLLFSIIMTVFAGYHTWNEIYHPLESGKEILLGISAYDVRNTYSFLIGSIFAGVIGTGFYPIFGNRVWCRFGCPLAAYMGLIQRFKSRFRITTNGSQCISCGNCSAYCEQGIDVKWYAQRGQDIVRASCVGCGICADVCPRGVLKLENAPIESRKTEMPIQIKKDGKIFLNK